MTMKTIHHDDATEVTRSCHYLMPMPSKDLGVIRDCPARLRPKYRVHAPE
jgi:hypothetical protein